VISGFYILDVDKMPVTKEEKRKRRIWFYNLFLAI
jgi:hypothetical protein